MCSRKNKLKKKMLRVLVVGYDKMLNALISGSVYSGHKVVGALRCDRVNYSKFTLFLKDIFAPSHDLAIIKAFGVYDINAPSINSDEFKKEFEKLKPDVILVCSWAEKIKPEIFSLAPLGTINLHPSLLPRHRGANPYFWTIYQNEDLSGITFHYVDEKFDCGDILLQEAVMVDPDMTAGELRDRCSKFAQGLVGELLNKLEKGEIKPQKQDESRATYEYQLSEKDTIVNLEKSTLQIHNHIRALKPWYAPSFYLNSRRIYIKKHRFLALNDKYKNAKAGSKVFENSKIIMVRTSDSIIEVTK